jgi:hypothetical protein
MEGRLLKGGEWIRESGKSDTESSTESEEDYSMLDEDPEYARLHRHMLCNTSPEHMSDKLFQRLVVEGLRGEKVMPSLVWHHGSETKESLLKSPLRRGYHFFTSLRGFKVGGDKSASKRTSGSVIVERVKVSESDTPMRDRHRYDLYRLRGDPDEEGKASEGPLLRRLLYVSLRRRKFHSDHRYKCNDRKKSPSDPKHK